MNTREVLLSIGHWILDHVCASTRIDCFPTNCNHVSERLFVHAATSTRKHHKTLCSFEIFLVYHCSIATILAMIRFALTLPIVLIRSASIIGSNGEEHCNEHLCYLDFCTKNPFEIQEVKTNRDQNKQYHLVPTNLLAHAVFASCGKNYAVNPEGLEGPNPCASDAFHVWWFAIDCPVCSHMAPPNAVRQFAYNSNDLLPSRAVMSSEVIATKKILENLEANTQL